MVVGEGKPRRITVVLGCGRGREGGFGDERLWEIWRGGWWESQGGIFGYAILTTLEVELVTLDGAEPPLTVSPHALTVPSSHAPPQRQGNSTQC